MPAPNMMLHDADDTQSWTAPTALLCQWGSFHRITPSFISWKKVPWYWNMGSVSKVIYEMDNWIVDNNA